MRERAGSTQTGLFAGLGVGGSGARALVRKGAGGVEEVLSWVCVCHVVLRQVVRLRLGSLGLIRLGHGTFSLFRSIEL